MPRKTPTPEMDVPDDVVGNDAAPEEIENDSVNQPPYDAKWISIKAAAQLAGVTGQSVRNAYENHEAFNSIMALDDGGTPQTTPHWFRTKMIDSFGNPTEYDVVYVDRDAVNRWIEARTSKPSTHGGAHGNGPKRHIVRLTDEQVAAQPTMTLDNGSTVPAITLADGTLIALEKPPQARRKPEVTPATNEQADTPMPEGVAQTDLFDVDLIEA